MSNDFTEFTDVSTNPAAAKAAQDILEEAQRDQSAKPIITPPADGFVRLSGGLVLDGKKVIEAEVQELTGEHEERLSKSRMSTDPTRWYNTLLRCGTVSIGGQDPEDLLDQLLVGDREDLALAIRKATYGADVEMGEMYCPECREPFEAVVNLDTDVPRNPFSGETQFEVKLRKGGRARVRLPNGADQTAYTEDPDLTDSERNSILLSRVVLTLPVDGEDTPVAGFPSLVRNLGVADRRSILAAIDKRQPGPRYDEVTIEHECGTKIPAPLGLVPLFPGL